MAAIDHSAYAPVVSSPFSVLADSMRNALRGVRTHIAYRQTHAALNQLSLRQLQDIGLEGTSIDAIAWDMAKRSTL